MELGSGTEQVECPDHAYFCPNLKFFCLLFVADMKKADEQIGNESTSEEFMSMTNVTTTEQGGY